MIAHTAGVTVRRAVVCPQWQNNVYLLTVASTGDQVLIDAAAEPDSISQLIADAAQDSPHPTRLAAIVTTHRHQDHIGALAEIVRLFPAPTFAGTDDADAITTHTGVTIDHRVSTGDQVCVAGLSLDVIGISGHTPGSIVLSLADGQGPTHLFVGDDLFPGGLGKTRSAQDFASLFQDVRSKLFDAFPDNTLVWPGHGQPTTMGAQRPYLPDWEARGW